VYGIGGPGPGGIGIGGSGTTGVYGSSDNSSGRGVTGLSSTSTGVGVFATHLNAAGGVALQVDNGSIKVGGTNRPVFVHVATAGNINGNYTDIDNPYSNGDSTAILIVTPNWSVSFIYDIHPIGVFYDTGNNKWAIFNQDSAAMPVNAVFNVLVVKQ
jgi:hypothetical protein